MSLLARVGGLFSKRSNDVSNPLHWITRILASTSSGVNVTADNSLKVSAVFACVKLLSETIASLPLMLYKREGEGKRPAPEHHLYPIVHDAPNSYMTSYEWREGVMAHQLLRGNTYNLKVQKASGKIVELIPLNPAHMDVRVEDSRAVYQYTYEDSHAEVFPAEKIWHVKNLPISSSYTGQLPEGYLGISPISAARESVGLAMAADDHGGRYFQNSATLGLALEFPEGVSLGDNAKTFLKDSLAEYAKPENKFKSIVLEKGGKINKLGISNVDSQFLESRQFQIEEIARIFRVPPIMIGHPTNTMTYASAEQLFLAFAVHTIRPWCVRLEQSMNRYLLSDRERKDYFFEFNMAGLLRGDTKSMNESFNIAHNGGWMNVDEIRALINMNPLPDGKGQAYLQPLNMVEVGKEPPKQTELPLEKSMRKADPVDWEKVYEEGGAHWTDDLQPSKFAQDFAQALVDEEKKSILEIGCGNGRDSILFALAGMKVTAIDMVQAAVDMAIENAKAANVSIDFQVGNAEKLSFGDKSFDSVFTLSVLHATNLKKSIPELSRVLKAKGMAFIFIYSNVEKISGEITDFIKVNDFIDIIKNNDLKIDDIYTLQEDDFDEAGEKHRIIVTRVKK